MSETIQAPNSTQSWHWESLTRALKTHCVDVVVDFGSVKRSSCRGMFRDISFFMSWVPNSFLLLKMSEYSQELVDALTNVVGYGPFCQYRLDDSYTVEWDGHSPARRLAELHTTRGVYDIHRLI